MSPDEREDFRSLGEILQDCRRQQGRSLEDVSEATKISPKMLHALETDEIEQLAGPIYARGFVKTLANFFAQDETELLSKLENLDQRAAPVEPPMHLERKEEEQTSELVPPPKTPPVEETVTWHVETVEDTAVKRVAGGNRALSSRWMWMVFALFVLVLVLWWWGKGSQEKAEEAPAPDLSSATQEDALPSKAKLREENRGTEIVEPSGNTLEDAVPQPLSKFHDIDLEHAILAGGGSGNPGGGEVGSPVGEEEDAQETSAATNTEAAGRTAPAKTGKVSGAELSDGAAGVEVAEAKQGKLSPSVAMEAPSSGTHGSLAARAGSEPGNEAGNESRDKTGNELGSEGSPGEAGSRLASIVRPGVEPPVAGQMHLELLARAEVEVWASADGEDSQHRILQPQESWTLLGWDHFSLRLRDPRAIEVKLDGVLRRPPRGLRDEWIIYPTGDAQ